MAPRTEAWKPRQVTLVTAVTLFRGNRGSDAVRGGQTMADSSAMPATDALPDTSEAPGLCSECGEHPRLGALSRCRHCIRAAADADRQTRAAAEARLRERQGRP